MTARLPTLVLCLLAALPVTLVSQAVTGDLSGRVLAAGGEPLENVTVTVSGPYLQGTRSATTDARGRFALLWLPAGTFTVRVRRMGYGPVAMRDVRVGLGTTTSLADVTLAPQAVEVAEIVVSGARPVLDLTSTANSAVMDSAFFRAIPTQRDFMHLAELVPLAMPSPFDSAQGFYWGGNVAGATELENGYFVDGIHATEISWASGAGLTLPTNFVREVQVLAGGYEAEYGRTQGGVVNVVTQSGGNEFRGQVLGYYAGDALRTTPRWGYSQLQIHDYSNWDVGASLGGPIQRERLWFFAAYDPSFSSRDVAYTGIAPQHATVARHLFAGKLTWRAAPNTEVVLTALGDPKSEERVAVMAYGGMAGSVGDSNTVHARVNEGGTGLALQARHWFGRGLLTASLTRNSSRLEITPRTFRGDLRSVTSVNDFVTATTSGGFGWQTDRDMDRTSAQVSLTHVAGPHTIKAGAEYEVDRYRLTDNSATLMVTGDTAAPYTWIQFAMVGDGHVKVPSAYLQDSWLARPGLRVNAGVRWDGYRWSGPNGPDGSVGGQIAPRLGVIVEPGAAGMQKISVSVGRFFEQVPLHSPTMWTATGTQRVQAFTHNPLIDTTGGTTLMEIPLGNLAAPSGMRGQSYDELTVGYERVVGRTLKLGVRALARRLGWIIEDATVPSDGSYRIGNPGRDLLAELPRATRNYRALEVTLERVGAGPLAFVASYVYSRNHGNFPGLFASDAAEGGGGPNSNTEYDAPDGMANATGLLPNDRTHVVKVIGSYRVGTRATVGAAFLAASGTPRSEYGTSQFGAPYWTFVRPRGSAGRTPWIWDLDLRGTYDLPMRGSVRPHLTLDVFNLGSPRRAAWYDDMHYNAPANPDGSWPSTNPNYGEVKRYQDPMSLRLGMVVDF